MADGQRSAQLSSDARNGCLLSAVCPGELVSRTSCIPDVCLSRGEPTNVVSIRHGMKSYHMPTPTANSRLVKMIPRCQAGS